MRQCRARIHDVNQVPTSKHEHEAVDMTEHAVRPAGDVEDRWTLRAADRALLGNKTGSTRLGFAVLLKLFQADGRFPRRPEDVPVAAVEALASQVDVPVAAWQGYGWRGRTIEYHHSQIRAALGFREATDGDAAALARWLEGQALAAERRHDRLLAAARERFRSLHLEPPSPDRLDRLVRSALHRQEDAFCTALLARLPPSTAIGLDALIRVPDAEATDSNEEDASRALPPLLALRAGTGPANVQSVDKEADKLQRIRALALPPELVRRRAVPGAARLPSPGRGRGAARTPAASRSDPADAARRLLPRARARDRRQPYRPADHHRAPHWHEGREARQGRADHRPQARHRKARAAVQVCRRQPCPTRPRRARRGLPPPVGEQTLHDLVAEGMATGPVYRRHLQTVIHNSYKSHYRRMLPMVLDALSFRSNNQAHQPVLDAFARHAARKMRVYPADENVPLDGVVPATWRDAVLEQDAKGRARINRTAYEICALQALREQLRCKKVWVEDADRYREPDQDLPADFDARRDEHYAVLGLPHDARTFIEAVRTEITGALTALDRGMATNPYVRILKRGGDRIAVTPLERQPDPAGLVAIKAEIGRRWPMTSLLDMLKEADLRIGFTGALGTVTDHENLPRSVLQERLLLCLNGMGTTRASSAWPWASRVLPTRTCSISGAGSSPATACARPLPQW